VPKQTYVLNDFSGGINNIKDSRDISDNQCAKIVNLMVDKQGAIRTAGSFTAYPNSGATENLSGDSSDNQAGNGLFYYESDYGTQATSQTTSNVSGSYGIVYGSPYNLLSQSSSTVYNAFDIGDKVSMSGTASNDGVYTIIAKYDLSGSFSGHQQYRFEFLEEMTAETGGISSAITLNSYSQYGAKFWMKPRDSDGSTAANLEISTWDSESESWSHAANIQPLETIDNYVQGVFKPVYYAIDNAVRVSDSNFQNPAKVKWFGYIERGHPDQYYHGWYTEDNDLEPPKSGDMVRLGNTYPGTAVDSGTTTSDTANKLVQTSQNFTTTVKVGDRVFNTPDGTVANVTAVDSTITLSLDADIMDNSEAFTIIRGYGVHWYVLHPADATSTWEADTYETGMTFIYDENQESQITEMDASYKTFAPAAGDSVTVKALLFTPYKPRMTGARLYCRLDGSDDEWVLLAETHFTKGIKATLDADYTAGWTSSGTTNQYYSATVTSLAQNLDTYETINGRSSSVKSISLGKRGELWKCAVVCNRRTFLANVKIQNEGTSVEDSKHYGDRILYSEVGKFDTFPSYNFIDVVKGDSEEYVSLVEYGDRLLAFKQKTLFIVNVSSPEPTGWFLEKTFKHNGVIHKEAVFRSEDGVVWANSSGCWYYNGSNVSNLVENKLDTVNATNGNTEHGLSWKDFYDEDTIVGYSPKYKQIVLLQDCSGATDPMNALVYDFRTQSWVQNSDQTTFFNNVVYSNFILDGDGELAIMTTGGVIRYYTPASSTSTSGIELITKFLDMGDPYRLKKVYKVGLSYKASGAQVDPLEIRYIDASGDMQSFADVDGSVDFANKTEWNVAVFTASSPVTCQSIQLKLNPPSSGTVDINEIMVDYRPLYKRVS